MDHEAKLSISWRYGNGAIKKSGFPIRGAPCDDSRGELVYRAVDDRGLPPASIDFLGAPKLRLCIVRNLARLWT
jgi:hypothetical protein